MRRFFLYATRDIVKSSAWRENDIQAAICSFGNFTERAVGARRPLAQLEPQIRQGGVAPAASQRLKALANASRAASARLPSRRAWAMGKLIPCS